MNLPHDIPACGHYDYFDPITKVQCSATTFDGLIARVGQVRSAMGCVAGLSLREELEKSICQRSPEDCSEVDMTVPRRRKFTLTDVIHGTKVLASFILDGSKPVSYEEFERRARICVACPYNIRFDTPCTGVCGELLSLAQKISGGQGTSYDRSLKSCAVCSCWNAAQCWIPVEHLAKGVTEDMRKQFKSVSGCWKGSALNGD